MAASSALKLIKQKHKSSGCGIACIAMLSGRAYDEIAEKIFPGKKNSLYTDHSKIKKALQHEKVKFSAGFKRVSSWDNISETSIVRIGRGAIWHYVVFDAASDKILDPLKGTIDRKKAKQKPVSFLAVKPHVSALHPKR